MMAHWLGPVSDKCLILWCPVLKYTLFRSFWMLLSGGTCVILWPGLSFINICVEQNGVHGIGMAYILSLSLIIKSHH